MNAAPPAVVWHELECGPYTADLPLWRRLADRRQGPILEIGAGTGRVSIDLAGRGHRVTALDHDQDLLDELARRAGLQGASVRPVLADARDFRLEERFILILAPMQTVQILGGESGRARFLGCASSHLSPGGRLAVAISERFELYDGRQHDAARLPWPDVQERSGTVYVSQPTAVRREGEAFVLERRREALSAGGERTVEVHQDRLSRLDALALEREAAAFGLRAGGRVEIPATEDHVGSLVVMLDV